MASLPGSKQKIQARKPLPSRMLRLLHTNSGFGVLMSQNTTLLSLVNLCVCSGCLLSQVTHTWEQCRRDLCIHEPQLRALPHGVYPFLCAVGDTDYHQMVHYSGFIRVITMLNITNVICKINFFTRAHAFIKSSLQIKQNAFKGKGI